MSTAVHWQVVREAERPGAAGVRPLPAPAAVDYSVLADDDLVDRLRHADAEAFRALFERHADHVYSLALRVVVQRPVAEDIVQEVFLKLWRRPSLFDASRGKFVTWLLSVTRNRAIDERRVRSRWFHQELPSPFGEEVLPASDATDPARGAVLADERAAVRGALATLPPDQRLAIEMAYFGGLSQSEIAGQLGLPLGTVKTRTRLAMQKLRTALSGREDQRQ